MSIWIDLDNSPHVPLFVPIINAYRDAGVEVVVTARDHAQTIDLLEAAGLGGTYRKIGKHYGKSTFHKLRGLAVRALQLAFYIVAEKLRGAEFKVAINHGSRSQCLIAPWLRIPVISMYDYEFTETRIFNRFSTKVMIPDAIPSATLDEIGLAPEKRVVYSGLKEELYLHHYRPDKSFWHGFQLDHGIDLEKDDVIVVLRPPATTANYHNEKSEEVLRELLTRFLREPSVFTVILPRTRGQHGEIENLITDLGLAETYNWIILDRAVNGLDLAVAADLLVSGGGTMNREAVLLGTPVYSIFAGRQGALDATMERDGRLTFIRSREDVAKVRLEKKNASAIIPLDDRVERAVRAEIDSFLS